MTVCIAAVTDDGQIVAASDKMLTAGNTEFEPNISKKVFQIANSIIVMCAGDMSLQAEIMHQLPNRINATEKATRPEPLTVKAVADVYEGIYSEIRIQRTNSEILSPFGLDEDSFLLRQNEMKDSFVADLRERISTFEMPEVEAVIAGIDKSTGESISPHIYSIVKSRYYSSVTCCDSVGYATIGAGSDHAHSQFMLARFHRHFSLPKALFLTYMAKKRAESAPGVGKETDLFLLGPTLSVCTSLHATLDYKKLEKMYEAVIQKEKAAADASFGEMTELLKEKLQFRPSKYD